MSDVYSYHTFLFPFIWEGRGKHGVPLAEFLSVFEQNENWINTDMPDEHHVAQTPDILTIDDALLRYKEYQYFHPYARKALYGFAEDIVTNYSFRPERIRNRAHYYIEKTGKRDEKPFYRKYDLLVNAIRLKVYNTGVAIFILECENHGTGITRNEDGKEIPFNQRTLDAVKEINDYGRRVTLPFIPTDWSSSLTADRLTLDVADIGCFSSDFKQFSESITTLDELKHTLSLTHFCDFIKNILSYGSDCRFTSRLTKETNAYYIYPALDDRMFVACYVMDTEVLSRFAQRDGTEKNELVCLNDEQLSKSLFELICIDPPGNCCMYDPDLRKQYLIDHMYNRWLHPEWGTITSYTNQSLISLTTTDCPGYLTESFLTQYVQVCCLVLVQRASIINFQRQTSALSAHVEERGRQIRLSTVSEVMKLQERFVAFQNQLSFTEITPQDQGIEIYDKLMEYCLIEKEITSLKDQLDCLCDAANTSLDYNFNKYALIFAVPTLCSEFLWPLIETIPKNFSITLPEFLTAGRIELGIYAAAILIVGNLLFKYRRRK